MRERNGSYSIFITTQTTENTYYVDYGSQGTRRALILKSSDSTYTKTLAGSNAYVWGQSFYISIASPGTYITKDLKLSDTTITRYEQGFDYNYWSSPFILGDVVYDGNAMQGCAQEPGDDHDGIVRFYRSSNIPVTLSQGTILNWESTHGTWGDYCLVNVNKSTASIPIGTYINVAPPVKYDMFFDHWLIDGTTETTSNHILVTGSSMNITPIYSIDSGYVVITLKGGCYIAYCDKMYKNISQKTAYVERGSTLIICPKSSKYYAAWFAKKVVVNDDTTITLNTLENDIYINNHSTNCQPADIISTGSSSDQYWGVPIWYDTVAQKALVPTPTMHHAGFPSTIIFSGYPLKKNTKLNYYHIYYQGTDEQTGTPIYKYKNIYTDVIAETLNSSFAYDTLHISGRYTSQVNPNAEFTCVVYDIEENTRTYTKKVGEEFEVSAATAPTGYEFYKWDGDIQYIPSSYQGQPQDKYSSTLHLNMPNDNFILRMLYKRQGSVILSYVVLHNGRIRLGDDPSSYTYVTEGEFPEDTILTIIANPVIQEHWIFSKWGGDVDSIAIVEDVFATETTITVPNYDVELTAEVMEHAKYTLALTNGEVAGSYYAGDLVSVYYSPPNGNPHYIFSQWTGDISKITLQGGGAFDPTYAGTPNNPQVIVMPEDDISLVAEYTVQTHTLTVINGTGSGLYAEGDPVSIQGTTPSQDMVFLRWDGDTSYITNPFVENTQVIMPGENITVTAIYVNTLQSNDVGYTMSDLSDQSTVDRSEVIIISGTIQVGFVITDCLGNIYAAIAVSGDTITIQQLVDSLLQYNDIGYVATDLTNVSTINRSAITVISGTIQTGFMITDSVGGIYTVTEVSGDTITIQSLIN